MLWLDEYERTARLAPGLLALLPVPILVAAFGVRHNPVVGALVSVVVAVGGPLVLAKYVRGRGRRVETQLYGKWGGSPTTLLLTKATAAEPDALLEQRRSNVERVARRTLPTTSLPHSPPDHQIFNAAVATLRQKTYDHNRYPLIYAENKSYGFDRNTYAIRAEARALNIAGLLVAAAGCALAAVGKLDANVPALAAATIVAVPLSTWWLLWPTEDRVRAAGNLYAEQLLDAAAVVAERTN